MMKCCCNSSFGTWRSGLAAVGFAVSVSWAFTGLPVLLGYGEPGIGTGAGDRAGEILAVVLVPLWVALGIAEGRLSGDGKGSGEECLPLRSE